MLGKFVTPISDPVKCGTYRSCFLRTRVCVSMSLRFRAFQCVLASILCQVFRTLRRFGILSLSYRLVKYGYRYISPCACTRARTCLRDLHYLQRHFAASPCRLLTQASCQIWLQRPFPMKGSGGVFHVSIPLEALPVDRRTAWESKNAVDKN